MSKGNMIDGGVTCTTMSALQHERLMRRVNGSGFDEIDAIELSLECIDFIEDEEPDDFSDPLNILLAEEDKA